MIFEGEGPDEDKNLTDKQAYFDVDDFNLARDKYPELFEWID